MAREFWALLSVSAYLLLFLGGVLGLWIWRIRRRRERPPVTFKLLRGPGETIRRRVAKFEEDVIFRLVGAGLIPVLAATGIASVILKFGPQVGAGIGIGVGFAVFGFTLIVAVKWTFQGFSRYRDDRLGYLGERAVAEYLQPLFAIGYQVYHDVPAKGAKSDFNLDHVAVGPSGVALIETKTRRKGRARPGMKDHVVTYDGKQLIWPWAEDRFGLEQAIAEADWLRQWLHQRTGIDVTVKPILALPGWWVEAKGRGAVTVVNAKSVASAVEGSGPRVLTPQQIDLICRQLDERCRDVED